MRTLVWLPYLLLSQAMCLASPSSAAEDEPNRDKPAASGVLAKAAKRANSMESYSMARTTKVFELDGDKRSLLFEISFLTASCDVRPQQEEKTPLPLNVDCMRLEVKGDKGSLLLVSGDSGSWWYSSKHQEYVKGKTISNVLGSVSGSSYIGLHQFPFAALSDGTLRDARMDKTEQLMHDGKPLPCYVVQGAIAGNLSPSALKKKLVSPMDPAAAIASVEPRFNPESFITMLQLQGIVGTSGVVEGSTPPQTMYSSFALDKEELPDKGTLTHVKLWIEKDRHFLRKSEMEQVVYRNRLEADANTSKQVRLRVIDEFTDIELDVPKSEFSFRAPESAKEVPKGGIGRNNRPAP